LLNDPAPHRQSLQAHPNLTNTRDPEDPPRQQVFGRDDGRAAILELMEHRDVPAIDHEVMVQVFMNKTLDTLDGQTTAFQITTIARGHNDKLSIWHLRGTVHSIRNKTNHER
ncbi:MAG: hypothetical protein AAF085_16095, partial [Planctomycetota bacterium]